MANLAKSLEKIVTVVGKAINRAQKAIDKVLWGSVDDTPSVPAPGTAGVQERERSRVGTIIGNLTQRGLYGVLDKLNALDLCNILESLTPTIAPKKKPRKQDANNIEKTLYNLQDAAALTRQAIDAFYATPNSIIDSLKNPNPQSTPAPGTTVDTNNLLTPDDLVGTSMQKYNFGIISKYISQVFKATGFINQAIKQGNEIVQESLLDPDILAALTIIPGFKTNLNQIQDFTNILDKYGDFRNIPNEDFQKLLAKLDNIRAACTVIENLSLGSAINFADQFLGSDIRSQIAELSKVIDPTKLVKTLGDINKSLQTFIRTCNSITANLRIARGIIKIALILIKVFKYIIRVISFLPIPLKFVQYVMVSKLEDIKKGAKDTTTGLEKFLEQLVALLGVIIGVVVYVQQNTQALLARLQILLDKLNTCKSLEGSDVLAQLNQTKADLIKLDEELTGIIATYNEKANKEEDTFGSFTIKVVEEELADEGIRNKRRRGIAIDKDGFIAAQSDLTFATNTAIIIEETKFKLVALGLASPSSISETDLVIAQAMTFLDDDIDMNDLDNIAREATPGNVDAIDTEDVEGSRKARKRIRKLLRDTNKQLKDRVAADAQRNSKYLGSLKK